MLITSCTSKHHRLDLLNQIPHQAHFLAVIVGISPYQHKTLTFSTKLHNVNLKDKLRFHRQCQQDTKRLKNREERGSVMNGSSTSLLCWKVLYTSVSVCVFSFVFVCIIISANVCVYIFVCMPSRGYLRKLAFSQLRFLASWRAAITAISRFTLRTVVNSKRCHQIVAASNFLMVNK